MHTESSSDRGYVKAFISELNRNGLANLGTKAMHYENAPKMGLEWMVIKWTY